MTNKFLPYPYCNADWSLIPSHMHDGLRGYVEDGIPPGKFLRSVLQNQFAEALLYADRVNEVAAKGWAQFLHRYLPVDCWGSREAVDTWIARGGLRRKPTINLPAADVA